LKKYLISQNLLVAIKKEDLQLVGTKDFFLLLAAIAFQSQLAGFSGRTYGLFLLIALLPQVVGHTSFNWALKYLSAPAISVILLGEPIGASVLAYFLLDEGVAWETVGGGVVTISGVALAIISERRV